MENVKPLFIFEMANNHQGSVEHGKTIIRSLKEACREYEGRFDFAVKFQFRDLDTFIHPAFKERTDIKNVRRFKETRLSLEQYAALLAEVRENGFAAVCTPFDEASVENIEALGFDYIKIASCSFGDWLLLEKIASARKPVIASAAGSGTELIDRVVSFFEHRKIDFSLLHCVAEYPTPPVRLEMNQIDYFRSRYPKLRIGFSTHEDPEAAFPVALAVAKGALIFEKHVGAAAEGIELNGYSASPAQVKKWLEAAALAFDMCGVRGMRCPSSEKEQADLAALRRGAFAKRGFSGVGKISPDEVFFAFPCREGQLLASHFSKYSDIRLKSGSVGRDEPIMLRDVEIKDNAPLVWEFASSAIGLLKRSGIVVPVDSSCELSHHFGLERYKDTGCALIDCVNREYCKKILVVLPGQTNPTHYHVQKEETFLVISGDLIIGSGGQEKVYGRGDMVVVNRGVKHYFRSEGGCVFEEISTTHRGQDSFYDDAEQFVSPRKTKVYITKEMVESFG